jgi:hypothetical protein
MVPAGGFCGLAKLMLMLLEIVLDESICPNAKKNADRFRPIGPVEVLPTWP